MGALITLVANAVDPFAQLVIHFESCYVPDPHTIALIPRRNTYGEVGPHNGAGSGLLSSNLTANINAGLINPVVVDYQCSSGSCEFPELYYSVAYCSVCQDITNTLTNICDKAGSCVTSLPSGIAANSTSGADELAVRFTAGYNYTSGTEVIMAPYSPIYSKPGKTWGENGFGAAACSLFPCVRGYQANIHNGVLREEATSTWTEWGQDNDGNFGYYQMLDTACLPEHEYGYLRRNGYLNGTTSQTEPGWANFTAVAITGADDRLIYYDSSDQSRNFSLTARCIYRVVETISIGSYLSNFFVGSVTSEGDDALAQTNGPSQILALYSYGYGSGVGGTVAFADLQAKFAGVAESITSYIRQHDPNDTVSAVPGYQNDATGVVIRPQTCIQVRWGWMALPVALLLITPIFLVSTIISCRQTGEGADGDEKGGNSRGETGLWKGDILAPLLHVVRDADGVS